MPDTSKPALLSVADAQARVLALMAPVGTETIALRDARGRVLAAPATAARDQPPFAASAMDGYAVRASDASPGARLRVIGEAGAGHAFAGTLGPGEAARIFTGAPMPDGADAVVIQEDTARDGDTVVLGDALSGGSNVRARGGDFGAGFAFAPQQPLRPHDLALLAAMNAGILHVRRRPVVAILATGDELVAPGETPRADQITASNTYALAAMAEAAGAEARLLPIARDTAAALAQAFDLAAGADLLVTVGGASVGEHDLVASAAGARGLDLAFHRIAMRPGKPLLAGRLGAMPMLGLPGNPVSAIVCGHLFLLPAVRALLGQPDPLPRTREAALASPVEANGPRAHYMRAELAGDRIRPFAKQDSALLGVLAHASALLVRPPGDPARAPGEIAAYLPLDVQG